MRISGHKFAVLLFTLGTVLGADAPVAAPLPPLPSELPVLSPSQNQPRRIVPVTRAQPRNTPAGTVSLPQFPLQPRTNAATVGNQPRVAAQPPRYQPQRYQPVYVPEDVLKWDASEKEVHAGPEDMDLAFSFSVTNVTSTNVTINWVRPSCGCTVAKLPPTPWTLKPGEGGNIDFNLDIRGKHGTLAKYVSVDTSAGQKLLLIKAIIPQRVVNAAMDGRMKNMQLAMQDRQVVFRGDCASCHAAPTVGKTGEALYTAACAICHDAPHRASMVPDLRALKKATNEEYWSFWIANGKPGTLMPGFAKAHGGPLDENQIRSLAEFMFKTFPRADSAAQVPGASTNATTSASPAVGDRAELKHAPSSGAGN